MTKLIFDLQRPTSEFVDHCSKSITFTLIHTHTCTHIHLYNKNIDSTFQLHWPIDFDVQPRRVQPHRLQKYRWATYVPTYIHTIHMVHHSLYHIHSFIQIQPPFKRLVQSFSYSVIYNGAVWAYLSALYAPHLALCCGEHIWIILLQWDLLCPLLNTTLDNR